MGILETLCPRSIRSRAIRSVGIIMAAAASAYVPACGIGSDKHDAAVMCFRVVEYSMQSSTAHSTI